MPRGGVKDFDYGYKGLVNRVYGLKKPVIRVGVFAKDGQELYDGTDTSVLDVAIWNEFGTATIPERSFIRAWFDINQVKCRRAMAAMMTAVIKGKYTKEQALELVAQRFVGEIQRRMAQGIPPPNADSTVRAKAKLGGLTKPLIDTGQLRSSISYSIDGKQADSKFLAKRKKARAKQKKKDRAVLKKRVTKIVRQTKRGLLKRAKSVFRKSRKALLGKKSRPQR